MSVGITDRKPDMLSKFRLKEEIAFEKDRAQRKLEIQMDGGSRRQKGDEKSRKSLQGKLRRHCAKRGRTERRKKTIYVIVPGQVVGLGLYQVWIPLESTLL